MIRAAFRLPLFTAGLTFCLVFLLAAASFAAAASPNSLTMQAEDEQAVTWTLNAGKVTSLGDSEIIEAEGDVVLRRGADYMKADYARYYASTKWVFLRGNVEARMGKDTMKAAEAEFDLRSRVGWLKQGEIFMDGPHMYFTGERIDKHWGDVYSFKEAKITACDGDVPAWSLTAQEAVVEIDGYAQLYRPNFQVKDTPVLFSPWMIIPAKKERQSGLLTPEWGTSSQRGFYYNQPFFWAIDESQDMTFNGYFMDKRGFMQGVQYRSRPSVRESLWLRVDWLDDKAQVNNDADDPVNNRDGLVRNNDQRFWARGMYEGHLFDPKWKFRADIDFVSDQNMLHEFKSGYSGYNKSRDELFSWFRRDIQERDLTRKSGFLLFRDWDRASVALSSVYMQDQRLGNGNAERSTDTTVQRFPQFDMFLHKGRLIEDLPLEVSGDAQAAYMYRRTGTRGSRYQMTPTMTLPLNGRYGSVIASGALQQSFYGTDVHEKTDGAARQDGTSQTVPTWQVDGSSELMRVYHTGPSLPATEESVGKTRWTAVRHAIQPRVRYRNIPLRDQSDNPRYDDGDRILPRNELTYSVTNVITRKRERVVAQAPQKEGDKPVPSVANDYLDVFRFNLEQSYDIREARRTDERDEHARRPYGDVIGEMEVRFDERVSFVTRSYWSPYQDEFTQHDAGVWLTVPQWGHLYTGYGYRRPLDEYKRQREHEVKTIKMSGDLKLFGPFSANFDYSYDYNRNQDVERGVQLVYNHQCFQLMGIFRKDGFEEHYGVRFVLIGLGD